LTLVGRRIEYFRVWPKKWPQGSGIFRRHLGTDVDDVRLRELYEQADFTVFLPRRGLWIVIVESIWNARPCIVHNSGSMAEIAADGGCVQVDMRDAALADAILALAEGDELGTAWPRRQSRIR
jgi:glycosyltransferase involved in cell wall biosynthesis